jgi:hypothetical protein
MPSIMGLEETLGNLKEKNNQIFDIFTEIFDFYSTEGKIIFPQTFQDKAWQYFANPLADGMNIVPKEASIVNKQDVMTN